MILAFTPHAAKLCKQLETLNRMRPHAWSNQRKRRLDAEHKDALAQLRAINAIVPQQWRNA